MPTYSYKCEHCGSTKEVAKPMAKSDAQEACSKCSMGMIRDFKADLFHTASDTYDKPIISDSLAVGIDQIAEHRKQFPDIRMTNEGQPVFDKYSTHEAYLEKANFQKAPAKIRRRAKKTTTV